MVLCMAVGERRTHLSTRSSALLLTTEVKSINPSDGLESGHTGKSVKMSQTAVQWCAGLCSTLLGDRVSEPGSAQRQRTRSACTEFARSRLPAHARFHVQVWLNLATCSCPLYTMPFAPAEKYAGPRRGHVFQMGAQGLGYYPDPLTSRDDAGDAASGGMSGGYRCPHSCKLELLPLKRSSHPIRAVHAFNVLRSIDRLCNHCKGVVTTRSGNPSMWSCRLHDVHFCVQCVNSGAAGGQQVLTSAALGGDGAQAWLPESQHVPPEDLLFADDEEESGGPPPLPDSDDDYEEEVSTKKDKVRLSRCSYLLHHLSIRCPSEPHQLTPLTHTLELALKLQLCVCIAAVCIHWGGNLPCALLSRCTSRRRSTRVIGCS
jgi:hypothetical protein